ncbi:MAG: EVE domain-containing protein [Acidobacteria bacterium]|nr:EVE domain-containing protein [Acidobacteriota bacterium]
MPFFLAKTDPETYSVDQFEKEKKTVWDGVTNPQAVNFIGRMNKGDWVFLYHSGGESAVVGLAKAESAGYPDPGNPKLRVVDLRFVSRLTPPTTLAEIKSSGLFSEFLLVRNGRLSTMECPSNFVEWLRARYPRAKF